MDARRVPRRSTNGRFRGGVAVANPLNPDQVVIGADTVCRRQPPRLPADREWVAYVSHYFVFGAGVGIHGELHA